MGGSGGRAAGLATSDTSPRCDGLTWVTDPSPGDPKDPGSALGALGRDSRREKVRKRKLGRRAVSTVLTVNTSEARQLSSLLPRLPGRQHLPRLTEGQLGGLAGDGGTPAGQGEAAASPECWAPQKSLQ